MRYLIVPLLLLLSGSAGAEDEPAKAPAGAAYEETEVRLKTAGIDEAMRLRIHAAIRDGVAALRTVQMRDGSILGHDGQTVLGGLALTHAGIPSALEGAAATRAWVLRRGRKAVATRTYQAGLAAMMFASVDRSKPEQAYLLHLHDRLRRGPGKARGYWGYGSGSTAATPNLSTAQFACLGLWAGERGGAKPARQAWRMHLEALLASQGDTGSWGYRPHGDPGFAAQRTGYATGTFMGAANLALAHHALAESLAEDPTRDAVVRIARAKAKAALRRHGQWMLTAPSLHGQIGHFPFYRLYALEKACIFLDVEDLGGIPWYREGAAWLLAQRLPDGGWPASVAPQAIGRAAPARAAAAPSSQATAFALLFLLRASAAYHPVTPRPTPRTRARVVTGGQEDADAEDTGTDAAKRAPPLTMARGLSARLEKTLAGTHLRALRPTLDAIRLIGRIYGQSRAGEGFATPGHEVWARRVDDLMLQLATRFHRARVHDRILWQAVGLAALEAMPDLHPRVGPRLMKAVLQPAPDGAFPRGYQYGWYATALEALRRIDPPGLAAWLGARALAAEPAAWFRSGAALTTLGGMATGLTGRQRHAVARAIWSHLGDVVRRSDGNPEVADLKRDILVLMGRLAAASGRATDLPTIGGQAPGTALDALQAWWRRHADPADPVWQDLPRPK